MQRKYYLGKASFQHYETPVDLVSKKYAAQTAQAETETVS